MRAIGWGVVKLLSNTNLLKTSGTLLVLLGILHLPVWLAAGGSWEGDVSWRKPILFGISTGVTLWSLAWLYGKIPRWKMDSPLGWWIAVSLLIEVGLITLQQWRLQPSHFNQTTAFDEVVDISMVLLISGAFLGILYFAVRSLGEMQCEADYALAFRGGMFFLVLSCVVGFLISFHGYRQVAIGSEPGLVGEKGVAKFPHGIAIHALQLLPMFVWMSRLLAVPLAKRVVALKWLNLSFTLQLVFAAYQTINGWARFEAQTMLSFSLLVTSSIALVVAVFYVVYWSSWNQPLQDTAREHVSHPNSEPQ